MNHLERLLQISEQKNKASFSQLSQLENQIKSLTQELNHEKHRLSELNIENQSLQKLVSAQKEELDFLTKDKENLLKQFKEQADFILNISNLTQNSIYKRYEISSQLKQTSEELIKVQQTILLLSSENSQLKVENAYLKQQNQDTKTKLVQVETIQFQQIQHELRVRDIIIRELQERIQQINQMDEADDSSSDSILEESMHVTENNNSYTLNQISNLELEIQKLQSQVISKEQQIIALQNQVLEFQKQQVNYNPQILSEQQIQQKLPIYLRDKVHLLNELKYVFDITCKKVAQLKLKQEEQDLIIEEYKILKQNSQKLMMQYQEDLEQKKSLENEFKYLIVETERIVLQNQAIKGYILQNGGRELLQKIFQDNQYNFEPTPFNSIDELIQSYLEMRKRINKINSQKFKEL